MFNNIRNRIFLFIFVIGEILFRGEGRVIVGHCRTFILVYLGDNSTQSHLSVTDGRHGATTGWRKRSKSRKGTFLHIPEGKTQWEKPTEQDKESVVELMVLEVIVKVKDCRRYRPRTSQKHNKSRRPSSWREKHSKSKAKRSES